MGEKKRVRERRTEEGKEESRAEETEERWQGRKEGEKQQSFCFAELKLHIFQETISVPLFPLIFLLLLVMLKEDEDCLPQFPPCR